VSYALCFPDEIELLKGLTEILNCASYVLKT
jgi:hypothetical protein